MNWFLIILLILMTSCGSLRVDPVEHRGFSVEREILPYLLQFEKDCNVQVEIHVRFENISWNLFRDDIAAYCYDLGVTYIHVDYDWWKRHGRSHDVREQLVFHELGHCVLDREHVNKRTYTDRLGGRPVSIMYPQVFGYWGEYIDYRRYYIEELCKKK